MKLKIYFISLFLLLIFSGCGGSSSDDSNEILESSYLTPSIKNTIIDITTTEVTTGPSDESGSNINTSTLEVPLPPSDSEFINSLDTVTLKSKTEIETWYKYSVPNVNRNKKIVKKDGRFLALIDPYIPPKLVAETGSTLIYSEDGLNWYDMNVELPSVCSSIIATETFFYAVGSSIKGSRGNVIRSINGYSWEEVYLSKDALSYLSAVANRDGSLIAVGSSGDIVISKDGVNWEEKYFGRYQLFNISYSENELVVAGGINMLSTKDKNMENWTLLDNNNLIQGTSNNLYANGLFLLIGSKVTRIYDGNIFKYIKRESNLKEVVYKDKFLNIDENNVYISIDSITWTKIAEIELVDENTTALDVDSSFIYGTDIIFTKKL